MICENSEEISFRIQTFTLHNIYTSAAALWIPGANTDNSIRSLGFVRLLRQSLIYLEIYEYKWAILLLSSMGFSSEFPKRRKLPAREIISFLKVCENDIGSRTKAHFFFTIKRQPAI